MSRITNYLALMVLLYLIYYGGKGFYDIIIGNTDNIIKTLIYALFSLVGAVLYYFYVYRTFRGK